MRMQNERVLDKPYQTYEERIAILKYRKLGFSDPSSAEFILSNYSYYDIINGYKECFMIDDDTYKDDLTIEDICDFHRLDKSVQNILFLYSTYVENHYKTALSEIVAKNISADNKIYISRNSFSLADREKLKSVLYHLNKECNEGRVDKIDDPTKYYLKNHNHVPPWILFKNITFSTCIDMGQILRKLDKRELVSTMIKININRDYKNDFLFDALTTVRKFRNAIAHNLKFITMRMPLQQQISFKQVLGEYKGTLLFDDRDGGKRCVGDPFSMIIALVSLIHDPVLLKEMFADLGAQFSRFSNSNFFSLYCSKTGIPEDILIRGQNYLNKKI